MRALAANLQHRGFGYVIALTLLVLFAGAAGMYAFENEAAGGLKSYGEALWWTAMVLTTMGSQYWLLATDIRRARVVFLPSPLRFRCLRLLDGDACNILRRPRCGKCGG